MAWTEERINKLRQLYSLGWPHSRIAAALGGVSRNAVIGKAPRLGLPGRRKDFRPVIGDGGFKPIPSIPRRKLLVTSEVLEQSQAPVSPPVDIAKPRSKKLSIAQLTSDTCRFPIGDPKHDDFHYCGHTSPASRVYCEYHSRVAFQEPKPRRNRAYSRASSF